MYVYNNIRSTGRVPTDILADTFAAILVFIFFIFQILRVVHPTGYGDRRGGVTCRSQTFRMSHDRVCINLLQIFFFLPKNNYTSDHSRNRKVLFFFNCTYQHTRTYISQNFALESVRETIAVNRQNQLIKKFIFFFISEFSFVTTSFSTIRYVF